MSVIEKELVNVASFKARRDYERQDYLAALARAINEVGEDEFDGLSVEAQDWFNDAVRALNKKQELPDFPDVDDSSDDNESEASGDEAEAEAAGAAEDEGVAAQGNSSDGDIQAVPAKRAKKAKGKATKKAEESFQPVVTKRGKGQPPRKLDHPPIHHPDPDTPLDQLDFAMDEFGIVKGTKNAAAAAMLAQGCRMADVTESIGGTYYNLLQRLVKQGHLLEKSANGILKLTHKDSIPKKKAKK